MLDGLVASEMMTIKEGSLAAFVLAFVWFILSLDGTPWSIGLRQVQWTTHSPGGVASLKNKQGMEQLNNPLVKA